MRRPGVFGPAVGEAPGARIVCGLGLGLPSPDADRRCRAGAAGAALSYHAGAVRGLAWLAALLGAVFIQIGTNLANDVFDYEKAPIPRTVWDPARYSGWPAHAFRDASRHVAELRACDALRRLPDGGGGAGRGGDWPRVDGLGLGLYRRAVSAGL